MLFVRMLLILILGKFLFIQETILSGIKAVSLLYVSVLIKIKKQRINEKSCRILWNDSAPTPQNHVRLRQLLKPAKRYRCCLVVIAGIVVVV